MIDLSDTDLLLRLANFEDHSVERKTSGGSKDWLKTVFGFCQLRALGLPSSPLHLGEGWWGGGGWPQFGQPVSGRAGREQLILLSLPVEYRVEQQWSETVTQQHTAVLNCRS
jgi:hypothetical protein